jgi:hypothetical protein
MAARGKPRVVFNVFVGSRRGGIMRGRKQTRLGPAHADDGFTPASVDDDMNEATEQALRALVRLLARQAAREFVENASAQAANAGHSFDGGLQ